MADANTIPRKLVPFERSKFLKLLGGTLATFAVSMVVPSPADASHEPVNNPCFGFGKCHCCSGWHCCEDRCDWPGGSHSHCPSDLQCWVTCGGAGNLVRCCDFHCGNCPDGHCICRVVIGNC